MDDAAANLSGRIFPSREDAMPNALEANTQTVLIQSLLGVGVIVALILALRPRARRGAENPGDAGLRRELAEVANRLAALETGVAQIVGVLPRTVQGVGVLRYNPFPDMGGNMSFSVALLDGRANGVVISVLNDRNGSRVYGKAVENGTPAHPLSDEEQRALALARESQR
jgi:hypothetical protein